ncbi:MAG TPA: hypothetical protein VNF73_11000, partial [Candidatus Saccharimonadales bacterium]|nr:hypothetical protein [Candidatus Saccharimonadales bacterium]
MTEHIHTPGSTEEAHHAALADQRARLRLHVPRLIMSHEIRDRVHGSSPAGRFNSRLALVITRSVGTMWAAYLFALIAFVSLPQALSAFLHGDTVTGINWLAQSFLQLVLLPIIIVGQQIISTAQDVRAEADHETLTTLHGINVQQLQILEQQHEILELLEKK